MDSNNWRRSLSCRPHPATIRLGQTIYGEKRAASKRPSRSRNNWLLVWRKFVKDRMRNKRLHNESTARVPYAAYDYSQNFDDRQSLYDSEPEYLSRSFSVRYSDASKMVLNTLIL